jgi:hypothetical protein
MDRILRSRLWGGLWPVRGLLEKMALEYLWEFVGTSDWLHCTSQFTVFLSIILNWNVVFGSTAVCALVMWALYGSVWIRQLLIGNIISITTWSLAHTWSSPNTATQKFYQVPGIDCIGSKCLVVAPVELILHRRKTCIWRVCSFNEWMIQNPCYWCPVLHEDQ